MDNGPEHYQNKGNSMNRRQFLKNAAATIVLSQPLLNILLRTKSKVHLQTAGLAAPASVSFENEMPDVTLDTYMGHIPNVKPEAYLHQYIAYTDPGQPLYFAVNHNASNLLIDFSQEEDAQNPGTWQVEVRIQTLGAVSSDTVEFVFADEPLAIERPTPELPAHFKLLPNAPNPFNGATRLRYRLPRAMPVRLAVYNTRGQVVDVLQQGRQPAGEHTLLWHPAPELATGVYFLALDTPQGRQTRKMVYRK